MTTPAPGRWEAPVQHEPARWLVLPCQHGQGLKLMRSAPACVTMQSACDGGALWVPKFCRLISGNSGRLVKG